MIALLLSMTLAHASDHPARPPLSHATVHAGVLLSVAGALVVGGGAAVALTTDHYDLGGGLMYGGSAGMLLGGVVAAAPFLPERPAVAVPIIIGLVAGGITLRTATSGDLDDVALGLVAGTTALGAVVTQLILSESSIDKLRVAPLVVRDGGGLQVVGRF